MTSMSLNIDTTGKQREEVGGLSMYGLIKGVKLCPVGVQPTTLAHREGKRGSPFPHLPDTKQDDRRESQTVLLPGNRLGHCHVSFQACGTTTRTKGEKATPIPHIDSDDTGYIAHWVD